MRTEITSWIDEYTGIKNFALRVYEHDYLQWQSLPCADEDAAMNQLKYYHKQWN